MMIIPTLTDTDERNFLDSLQPGAIAGYANSFDQSYYARVLRQKYPQARKVIVQDTFFQITQPGISAQRIDLTPVQRARQQLFDAYDPELTKAAWVAILGEHALLPRR